MQILASWIISNYSPCKVADISGGNGLLTYLLNLNGFNSIVIDPLELELPWKYTSLDKKVNKIPGAKIDRKPVKFNKTMALEYDLLLGLHAHGVMIDIIDAAKEYNKKFIIVPCCVVDEPVVKQEGIKWTDSLYDHAVSQDLKPSKINLGFMGRDIAIYN